VTKVKGEEEEGKYGARWERDKGGEGKGESKEEDKENRREVREIWEEELGGGRNEEKDG